MKKPFSRKIPEILIYNHLAFSKQGTINSFNYISKTKKKIVIFTTV